MVRGIIGREIGGLYFRDDLLMQVEGSQTVYYHEDRLGSVTGLTQTSFSTAPLKIVTAD